MPLLSVADLHKSYFGVEVLHGVGFALEPGEIRGLIGENGSGKSTSMNVLGGVVQRDSGTILLNGQPYEPRNPKEAQAAGIAFIHQELNLFENLSIEENMFLGGFPRRTGTPFIDRGAMRRKAAEALAAIEITHPPSTPVARLSQGERQLVEIARAVMQDARIIIFDEPTTSLTKRETERLFALVRRLRERGIAMIYISHILSDVLALCDTITVLRDGNLVGEGRAADMTIDSLIRMMVGRSLEQIFPERPVSPPGQPVLQVDALSQPGIVRDISLTVRAGEVVGLAGLMGSGRSELARILFGMDPHETGTIRLLGETVPAPAPREMMDRGMAFLTEDRRAEGLLMEASIEDNVGLPSLAQFAPGLFKLVDRVRLAASVGKASDEVKINTRDYVNTLARTLSGGNQQKVVLAKWLMREPRFFILDEPTRGIDVGARYEVYKIVNGLVAGGAGVLMISSELEELIGMCDRIVVMSHGEIRGEFPRSAFDSERIMEAAMWKPKVGAAA